MINYRNKLEAQIVELDSLIVRGEKDIEKYKNLSNYGVNISRSHGNIQYYLIDRETGKKKYAGKKQIRIVQKIVQRDYDLAVNKIIKSLRDCLADFVRNFDIEEINNVYEGSSEGRKKFISPIIEPDELFIQRWLEENADNQNPFPEKGNYYTSQGTFVRSKSERIIAELLDKYNVPYRYEPQLILNNRHIVYPDFMVLNVRKRETIYWEHLGLVSDIDYSKRNFEKINDYERAGILLGKNLIISMESEERALDVKMIEKKIKQFCL